MCKALKNIISFLISFSVFFSLFLPINSYAKSKSTKITKDDLIYFIVTDRFFDGDKSNDIGADINNPSSYEGGDFQGIIDKLDYIKSLGFTAIWITPVVQNQEGGYHGYWATDFYKTNEHFGTMDKLKELVNTAHKKGIKVLFDLVVNHTGTDNPWVSDPSKASWFHADKPIDYSNQDSIENGWLAGLPDLNQDNPEVKKYLIDMAKWWIKETAIDGYRLDTVKHVPKSFWTDFTKEIKKDYPDFYFVGEVLNNSAPYVASYQDTGIDGLLDYPAYYAIDSAFNGTGNAYNLQNIIQQSDTYSNKSLMATFIDNHDVKRFVSTTSDYTEERLKASLTFMMTYTGIPTMYYGTEIGMGGGDDPDNRRFMDWSKTSPITDYVKKLTSIRKSNEALTGGDINILYCDDEALCFSRQSGNKQIFTVFNTSAKDKHVEIPMDNTAAKKLINLIDNKKYSVSNGKLTVELAPLGSLILAPESSNLLIYVLASIAVLFVLAALIVGIIVLKRRKHK
ncbi:alpha-glucosidase C-terminal domain-containing protein [Clostridium sp. 19966]|uniref:alpha-amylase family glycosyl hydrolase n=1 Tax=Clostridium sp. 19966 TaxID=2768166 RepID=UPI0028DD8610|nr:alpha-amylase family glycosyl hydrolase [Clostridium sp. 19966]MDT8717081.1 alpha-glucosidase C-terminal domain-containing protein [Clostridium sp. 19966]